MMALFLSPEWFAQVDAGSAPADRAEPAAVLEQVVEGGPGGRITYRVEVGGDRARIVWPVPEGAAGPDLRVTSDWPTAVSIAKGEISTQRALMQGRLRVSGAASRLAELSGGLAGMDPVPAAVRRTTTYDPAG